MIYKLDLMSLRTTSLQGLARSGFDGEELVVANLSAFAKLFEGHNSCFDQILTERENLSGIIALSFALVV
jgi:hypothetical protein